MQLCLNIPADQEILEQSVLEYLGLNHVSLQNGSFKIGAKYNK